MDNGAANITFDDVITAEEGLMRERSIAALVKRMSLGEKLRQMAGSTSLAGLGLMAINYGSATWNSGRNKRLGIPPIKFTDGPRGICLNHSTCFPVAIARGATWDEALAERVGSAMGIEARAQGANFFGGVCVNVPRHPGWGRAQETFGEDPHLLGVMGVATVKGVQRHVMACVKHFACNSMEEARFFVDVRVDERTLREIYLPHFKRCVGAGAASIMSAYNQVNGEYCGHNTRLLRDILKRDWGFDGFVMSDFTLGLRDGRLGALAGLDIEMPYRWRYGPGFKHKVKRGKVPVSVIDESVTRVLRQKARFSTVGKPGSYDISTVAGAEHANLALEVARKGIVLLKNEAGALPLQKRSIKKLAIIGSLASKKNIGDHGSSRVRPPYVATALDGIRNRAAGDVEVIYASGRNLNRARLAARDADAVVVVAGLTHKDEGEFMPVIHTGGDRENLLLPLKQERLIKAVADENGRCVVVLEGGGAIVTTPWQDEVEAILMAWYPGMEGGNAVADILFGDVNPGGKLPMTFPASNEATAPFHKKAKSEEYGYYHGYRLNDREGVMPAFAFGFGLSYTKYAYSNLRLSASPEGAGGAIRVEADVTNVGEVAGAEIAQLYVGYQNSSVERPVKELKGFTRVFLRPGESRSVSFDLVLSDLAFYDIGKCAWIVEEICYTVLVGASSRRADLPLVGSFTVSGSRQISDCHVSKEGENA